jgi:hypothetical protein
LTRVSSGEKVENILKISQTRGEEIMLRYTHIYELLYRIGGLLITVLFVAEVLDTLGRGLPAALFAIIFLGCCVGMAYLLLKTTGWIPTFLYIRLTLLAKVSPSDAGKLSFLFDGSLENGKWYPLLEIKDLPSASRRDALFQFAKKIATKDGQEKPT